MPNTVPQTPATKDQEADPSQFKTWLLAALLTLLTLAFSVPFHRLSTSVDILTGTSWIKIVMFILGVGAVIVALSLLSLAAIGKKEILIICLAQTLSFAAMLVITSKEISDISRYLYAGLGVIYGFSCAYFLLNAKYNISEYLHFRPLKIFPRTVRLFFIIITILVSANFYFHYNLHIKREGFSLPENLVNSALSPATKLIEQQLGKQLNNLVGQELEQKIGISGEQQLLEFMKEESIETLREGGGGREQLGLTPENLNLEQIEILPSGEIDIEPVANSIGEEAKKRINAGVNKYIDLVAPVTTLLLFLALTFFDTAATYIFSGVITVTVHILKGLGFIKSTIQQEDAERLVL